MRIENNIGTDFHRFNKDIGYTHEFRDFIKKDPKVIADFKHLWERLNDIPIPELQNEKDKQTFTEGSIRARLINEPIASFSQCHSEGSRSDEESSIKKRLPRALGKIFRQKIMRSHRQILNEIFRWVYNKKLNNPL